MVPVKCAVCGKTVSMFEAATAWRYRYDYDSDDPSRLRSYSADICTGCLPGQSWEENMPPKQAFSEPEPGSQDRFEKRRREVPWVRHTFWWIVHNCVSHPLIGILPLGPLFRFHDWTSVKMHEKEGRSSETVGAA